MSTVIEKWDEILEIVKKEHDLSDVRFDTWLKPLKVYDVSGNVVTIVASDQVRLSYINKNYKLPLQVTISEVTGMTDCEVKFILPEDVPAKKSISDAAPDQDNRFKARCEEANLNPKYTFNTFIVGSNNKLAQAAALAVAESPGNTYNPLFIYGGAGLGKTHLMHSIAHFIIENDDNSKVLYVTSEEFTNELIEALKNGKTAGNESAMSKFRDKYRNNDVLLIDDIQFIIGKESTQEEFFHTFNHLHTSGKQIIISSDKPPKDIETLEARLRTRFEWGLIADISSPNYETRMAILQKKIELDHLEKYNIPNDVLEYIATNVKTNIRELEGSLNKLIALYKLNNTGSIDIALAAEALKDIISSDNRREVTPELILDIVSEHFGVSISDLKGNKRNAEIVFPRQIAMYLIRNMTETSLKAVGVILGGKDHSTIKHGIEKIENELKADETLSNTINIIKKKINPA
jgi:chromosomal replication initiator protein